MNAVELIALSEEVSTGPLNRDNGPGIDEWLAERNVEGFSDLLDHITKDVPQEMLAVAANTALLMGQSASRALYGVGVIGGFLPGLEAGLRIGGAR